MPYVEKLSLESADHAARAAEIYGLVDGALTAHPAWSKVTDGYAGNTSFTAIDVWENDGSADGYGWYLMVGMGAASQSTYQGRVLLGGALEYDPATNIAKKALRGYSGAGTVDADGYPASAGGNELNFFLSSCQATNAGTLAALGGSMSLPATAAGQWVRVLVTGQAAWIGWGTPTTLVWSHAVGTYTNLHSATADQKPLAHQVVNTGSAGPTTVWQHPDATDSSYSRTNIQWASSSSPFMASAASALYGEVGATADLLRGGPVGSRLAVQRNSTSVRESPTSYMDTAGGFLGLSPKEFLVFDRASGVQIGDTVTVDGRAYVSVDSPSSKPSLFVCQEPDA